MICQLCLFHLTSCDTRESSEEIGFCNKEIAPVDVSIGLSHILARLVEGPARVTMRMVSITSRSASASNAKKKNQLLGLCLVLHGSPYRSGMQRAPILPGPGARKTIRGALAVRGMLVYTSPRQALEHGFTCGNLAAGGIRDFTFNAL